MRTLLIPITLAAASLLAACANSGQMNSDAQEFAQLQSKCEAQGGRFVTTGRMTGRPALDNMCKNFTSLPGGQNGPATSRDPG